LVAAVVVFLALTRILKVNFFVEAPLSESVKGGV
jgi:hypothetical protein